MPADNYYGVLELNSDASPDEIKRAYKRLALMHHPDKSAEADRDANARKFKEISHAYEVLRDPDSRRKYDEERRLEAEPPRPTWATDRSTFHQSQRATGAPESNRGGRWSHFGNDRYETDYGVRDDRQYSPQHRRPSFRDTFVFSDPFSLFNEVFAALERDMEAFFPPVFQARHGRHERGERHDRYPAGDALMPFGFGAFPLFRHGGGFGGLLEDPFAAMDRMFDEHHAMSDGLPAGTRGSQFSSHTIISNGRAKTVSVTRYTDRDGRVHEERHESENEVPIQNGGGRWQQPSLGDRRPTRVAPAVQPHESKREHIPPPPPQQHSRQTSTPLAIADACSDHGSTRQPVAPYQSPSHHAAHRIATIIDDCTTRRSSKVPCLRR